MTDATEGGLATALHEMAEAAEVGVLIDAERVPLLLETERLCVEFNLDPFGVLNRVFPIPRLGDKVDAYADSRAFELPLEVYSPVGGDHFVAIATEQPPLALYDALKSLDGRPVEAGFLTVLRQAVADQRHEMGLHGVFTAE